MAEQTKAEIQADLDAANLKIGELEAQLAIKNDTDIDVTVHADIEQRVENLTRELEARNIKVGELEASLHTALENAAGANKRVGPVKVVKGYGVEVKRVSDDLSMGSEFKDDAFIHVEVLNFRNDVGYDDNWPMRAKSALDRALDLGKDKTRFGALDPSGMQSYSRLPGFQTDNRLILMVKIERGD